MKDLKVKEFKFSSTYLDKSIKKNSNYLKFFSQQENLALGDGELLGHNVSISLHNFSTSLYGVVRKFTVLSISTSLFEISLLSLTEIAKFITNVALLHSRNIILVSGTDWNIYFRFTECCSKVRI